MRPRPASSIRILRAATRSARPWKNGGGVTRELAAYPPGSDLEQFDWRVSIAEIHTAGAFSIFPGIERRMAVLSGRLSLSIDRASARALSPDTPPLAFAGESTVFAEPLGGAVTDLNVMTRRGRFASRMTHRLVSSVLQLAPQPDTRLILALADFTVRGAAPHAALAPLDALEIEPNAWCELTTQFESAALYLIEIIAEPMTRTR